MVQTNHSPITFSPEFFADHAGNEQEGSDVQELVWRNGKLATQSYNQKSPFRQPDSTFFADSVPFSGVRPKLHLPDFVAVEETLASDVPPPPFWQEDEIASWFDHYPLDDALLPTGTSGVPGKTPPPEAGSPRHGNTMPESSQKKVINFSMFAMPAKLAGRKDAPPNRVAGTSERLELETCTVVDSCETPVVANSGKPYRYKSNVPVQATECSRDSGGRKNGSDSNESMRGMSTLRCKKRRNRESDGSHSHSEDAEDDESMSPGEGKRWSSKRRNRSTETHNLSERRRRDRINEKMRALQELLPQYNKSDKASLLDEAIEYLKSLQFQVQMMSMGYHMPHMMFPGHHSLMTSMGMARAMGMVAAGMAQALMPFTPNMLSASPHYTGLSSSIPQAVHPVPIPALCAKSESSFNTVSPTMTQPIPAEYRQFLGQLNMQVSPKVALAPNPSPSTSNETVPRSQ